MAADHQISETSFCILASLIEKRHGYAVMQETERLTDGRIKLGPGTLYGALKTMVKRNWIEEIPGNDSRKRLYRISQTGKTVLAEEITRIKQLKKIAEQIESQLDQGDLK